MKKLLTAGFLVLAVPTLAIAWSSEAKAADKAAAKKPAPKGGDTADGGTPAPKK